MLCFNTPQQAQENADGVALATQAAAQGLTVAEYQDQTNAGRTPIKVAVERFLGLAMAGRCAASARRHS